MFQPRLEDFPDDGDVPPLLAFRATGRSSRRKQTFRRDGSSTSSASETELMRSPPPANPPASGQPSRKVFAQPPPAQRMLGDVNRNLPPTVAAPGGGNRVTTVLVRQENELTFTALTVSPSTVKGFVKVGSKFLIKKYFQCAVYI